MGQTLHQDVSVHLRFKTGLNQELQVTEEETPNKHINGADL